MNMMNKKVPALYKIGRFILKPIFQFYYNPKSIGHNIITKEGKLLWRPEDTKNTDKWFDWLDCQCAKYGFYPVSIYDFKGDNYNNCYNILKSDGTFVFDENVSKDEIRIKAQQMVQDIKKQRNSIQESLNRYLSNNLLKIRY